MIDNSEDNYAPSPSTNLVPGIAGLLCYLFGWISGLVFLVIEKENHTVRFHAIQSIFFNIGISIIYLTLSILTGILITVTSGLPGAANMIFILLQILFFIFTIIFFVIWIMLMVRAYRGEIWKLPLIGDIAEQNS